MIHTNELRLGNLLQRNGQVSIVTSISRHKVETEPWAGQQAQNAGLHEPEYIPLTEEWIDRCAAGEQGSLTVSELERTSDSSDMILLSTVECYLHEDGFLRVCAYEYEKQPDGTVDVSDDVIILGYTNIRYVHQLQNLYFDLSGKELEWAKE